MYLVTPGLAIRAIAHWPSWVAPSILAGRPGMERAEHQLEIEEPLHLPASGGERPPTAQRTESAIMSSRIATMWLGPPR